MISKKDVYMLNAKTSVRVPMIKLSLLKELRQQLLCELKNNLLNKRKFNSELESLQNTFVFDACRIVRKVLGVEGESNDL